MLLFKVLIVGICMVTYNEATSYDSRLNNIESKMRSFEKLTGRMNVHCKLFNLFYFEFGSNKIFILIKINKLEMFYTIKKKLLCGFKIIL